MQKYNNKTNASSTAERLIKPSLFAFFACFVVLGMICQAWILALIAMAISLITMIVSIIVFFVMIPDATMVRKYEGMYNNPIEYEEAIRKEMSNENSDEV